MITNKGSSFELNNYTLNNKQHTTYSLHVYSYFIAVLMDVNECLSACCFVVLFVDTCKNIIFVVATLRRLAKLSAGYVNNVSTLIIEHMDKTDNNIVIYQSEDGKVHLDVVYNEETMWLTQQQMSDLYQTSRTNIVEHIKHIYKDGELTEEATCRKFRQVRLEGNRSVEREIPHYNLDMILSLGYRVRSITATRFRQWATERLKEYIIKGFTMDDERLKQLGGGNYWKELLDRIRDIRSSEKVMYRQVLDLYATAVDYDPRSELSIEFFKIVQNKLHFAAHGHTAAEVIYERADAEQPFMGLTTFKGEHPTLADVRIAKNYLSEDELKILNNLVSGYFDFAEIQAMKHRPMYMSDYIRQLDNILSSTGELLLNGAGKVSHAMALSKAESEYRKYELRTLSPVEQAYLDTIKQLNKEAKNKSK